MKHPQSSYILDGRKITLTWMKSSAKRFGPVTQIYGVCFNDRREILVCKENSGSKWQLPGGKPEEGEAAAETLKREFLEEVNVEIENISMLGAQKVEFPDNPNKEEGQKFYQLRHICKVRKLLPRTPDPATGKIWERKFVPTDKIGRYIKWGEIGEAMFSDAIRLWNKSKIV